MRAMLVLALLAALPVLKVGFCPAGYSESGGYCAPMTDKARPAIPKHGQCPANWTTSGSYCLGPKR
jgi:hypothetical protein